jgi:hypothetical protein
VRAISKRRSSGPQATLRVFANDLGDLAESHRERRATNLSIGSYQTNIDVGKTKSPKASRLTKVGEPLLAKTGMISSRR